MQGSTVMCQSSAETLVTEEPYALIAHVRVCGGAGWVTIGSTRNDQPRPTLRAKESRPGPFDASVGPTPRVGLGFEDEVWWSRVAQPLPHAWTAGPPMK